MINNCIICLENNDLIKYPCYYNNCKCIYYVHKNVFIFGI